MIPIIESRELVTQGVKRQGSFGISAKDTNWVKAILRDKIYTDKILAVLREYASNARDANREAGRGDEPIRIHVPTSLEPELTIRDHGFGLSEDQMFEVFTQYGHSTKRENNDVVGLFGIGCKSGHSYADQYTITSWQDGFKSVYIASLTDTDDSMVKLGSWPSDEPSGLEIKIPVKESDVGLFREKARVLYAHFDPLPNINIELAKLPGTPRKNGYVKDNDLMTSGWVAHEGWYAVMGCIPYKVDFQQMPTELSEADLTAVMTRVSGGLFFDVGEIDIAPSREGLEYTSRTRAALVQRAGALLKEYIVELVDAVLNSALSNWDKRLKVLHYRNTLKLHLPPDLGAFSQSFVTFGTADVKTVADPKDSTKFITVKDRPEHFYLRRNEEFVWTHPITSSSRIFLRDDDQRRVLKGYDGLYWDTDTILVVQKGSTMEQAQAELGEWLVKLQAEGCPIRKLSDLNWSIPVGTKIPNQKHKVSTFRAKLSTLHNSNKLSDNWEICNREPQDDDVYVVLRSFKSSGEDAVEDLYGTIMGDRKVCSGLGVPFPALYGYKDTDKQPFDPATVSGRTYKEWRSTFFKPFALDPQLQTDLLIRGLVAGIPELDRRVSGYPRGHEVCTLFTQCLGDMHPMTLFVGQVTAAEKVWAALPSERRELLRLLEARVSGFHMDSSYAEQWKALLKRYPLFNLSFGDRIYHILHTNARQHYFDYIKMIDVCANVVETNDV